MDKFPRVIKLYSIGERVRTSSKISEKMRLDNHRIVFFDALDESPDAAWL
jgi:hypothetical protein